MTRWWFQIFFFTPIPQEIDSHFDSHFSKWVGSTPNHDEDREIWELMDPKPRKPPKNSPNIFQWKKFSKNRDISTFFPGFFSKRKNLSNLRRFKPCKLRSSSWKSGKPNRNQEFLPKQKKGALEKFFFPFRMQLGVFVDIEELWNFCEQVICVWLVYSL